MGGTPTCVGVPWGVVHLHVWVYHGGCTYIKSKQYKFLKFAKVQKVILVVRTHCREVFRDLGAIVGYVRAPLFTNRRNSPTGRCRDQLASGKFITGGCV